MVAESNATYLVIGAGLAQLETMGMLVGTKSYTALSTLIGANNFFERASTKFLNIDRLFEYQQLFEYEQTIWW